MKYQVCGCTPSCWRCREKCNKFQVKIGDRLNIDPEDDKGKAKSRERLIQEILARLKGIKRKLEKK